MKSKAFTPCGWNLKSLNLKLAWPSHECLHDFSPIRHSLGSLHPKRAGGFVLVTTPAPLPCSSFPVTHPFQIRHELSDDQLYLIFCDIFPATLFQPREKPCV